MGTVMISSGSMGMGYLHINFDERFVLFDRQSKQSSIVVSTLNKKVPFSDITGIEMKNPTMLTGGHVGFIINNIRYKQRVGQVDSSVFIFNTDKKNYSQLLSAITQLSRTIGVAIRNKNAYPAQVLQYTGKYDIANGAQGNVIFNKIETRKRCNVCGHVFCYNNEDLAKNASHAKSAMWSSVAGVTGALGGAYAASAVSQSNTQRSLDKIVDYTRCPKCNSTNLSVISEEEFKKLINQNAQNSQTVQSVQNTQSTQNAQSAQNNTVQQPMISVADEIMKFKQLLDNGIITQEEFDKKKTELLNL